MGTSATHNLAGERTESKMTKKLVCGLSAVPSNPQLFLHRTDGIDVLTADFLFRPIVQRILDVLTRNIDSF